MSGYECVGDHCVTCSDEAVPLRVERVVDGLAVCEGGLEVMVDLVGPVEPGDELLVHAGAAIARAEGRGRDGARTGARVSVSPVPESGQ